MKYLLPVSHAVIFWPLATAAVLLAIPTIMFAGLAYGADFILWNLEHKND